MTEYFLPIIRPVPELCLDIARAHLRESDALLAEGIRRDANGGTILTPDPEQRSMQAALIATEFAAAFMESATWLAVLGRLPFYKWKPMDFAPVEERLKELSIEDAEVSATMDVVRELHVELYHGKPSAWPKAAQAEARRAVAAANRVEELLAGLRGHRDEAPPHSARTSPA